MAWCAIIAFVILHLVRGRPSDGWAPPVDFDARRRLSAAALPHKGLETVVVGWRADAIIIATAWVDAESMLAATGGPEAEQGFVRRGLGLAVSVDLVGGATAGPGRESAPLPARDLALIYEVASRTFAQLPADHSVLRVITIDATPGSDAALLEALRTVQLRLVNDGLIASHVARRVTASGTEAIVVALWTDHEVIAAATGGNPSQPAGFAQFGPYTRSARVEIFDAVEIAPRLPLASGPPIVILDDDRRVVDLTPSAAAVLGRDQDQALWERLEDLTGDLDWVRDAWSEGVGGVAGTGAIGGTDGSADGSAGGGADQAGESGWLVPSGGLAMVRWRLRRDAPVAGRHALLVRRRSDPMPTADEMDLALDEVFARDPA